jgi:hypothetical protein
VYDLANFAKLVYSTEFMHSSQKVNEKPFAVGYVHAILQNQVIRIKKQNNVELF